MKKILTALLLSVCSLSYAQYPSDFSLESLEKSYKQNKECLSSCGNFTGIKIKNINLSSNLITFEIPVSARQLSVVELPFDLNSLTWLSFSLDGKTTNSIGETGNAIMVAIPKGNHTLEVNAKIKNNQFKIPLLQDPKYFENQSNVSAEVKKIGVSFFIEIQNNEKIVVNKVNETSVSNIIFDQPLYEIKRELVLSDKWILRTTVIPSLKKSNGIVTNISVPLLDGENILNNNLVIKNGSVQLSLVNDDIVMWESNIAPRDKITFKNTDKKNVESWAIFNENNWLYTYSGVNPIESGASKKYQTINSWTMWPEEKVTISFSLPTIAEGQLTNVVDLSLTTNWTEDPLHHNALFVINTSIGGRYTIKFEDKKTELIEAFVNNVKNSNSIKDGELALDLLAGANQISINFKSGENKFFYKAPIIKFETPVTNSSFVANLSDRWILLAGGGDIRPGILLWGIILFFSIAAFFLKKEKNAPLGLTSWLLLLIGLSQFSIVSALIVIMWIIGFANRDLIINRFKINGKIKANIFNSIQTGLAISVVIGIGTLISVVGSGLLSDPDVFVLGVQSNKHNLFWYIQSWDGMTKNPWVISIPLSYYRMLVLGWGVWLAFSLMTWLKWMWVEYSKGGYWMKEDTTKIVEFETVEDKIDFSEEK